MEEAKSRREAVDPGARQTVSDVATRESVSDAEPRKSVSDAKVRHAETEATATSKLPNRKTHGTVIKSGGGSERSSAQDDKQDKLKNEEPRD